MSTPTTTKPAPAKTPSRSRSLSKELAKAAGAEGTVTPIRKPAARKPAAAKPATAKPASAKATASTKPAQQAKPEVEGEDALGTVNVEEAKQTLPDGRVVGRSYYFPTATLANGTVIECGHEYLHENDKTAWACARKMRRDGEFTPRSKAS